MIHNSANPAQLFQLLPPHALADLVVKWGVDKNVRRFSTSQMIEILIMRSLFHVESLRMVEGIFHVPKSTFADSLKKRSCGFFEDLCALIIRELVALCPSRKDKKALRKLLAVDSTEIRLHGSLLHLPGWREGKSHCAAAKIHIVWNVTDEFISDYRLTNAVSADLPVAKKLPLKKHVMYVFDRAYSDLGLWLKVVKKGSHFVTRLKKTPRHERIVKAAIFDQPEANGVLFDGEWTPSQSACERLNIKPKTLKFRQVVFRDCQTKKVLHFITSDKKITAEEVAEIYRRRWAVELLFRWLKGHLAQFRSISVRSPNAVRVYIASALLTQLLLRLKHLLDQSTTTMNEFLRQIRCTILGQILSLRPFQRFKAATPNPGAALEAT